MQSDESDLIHKLWKYNFDTDDLSNESDFTINGDEKSLIVSACVLIRAKILLKKTRLGTDYELLFNCLIFFPYWFLR